MTLTNLICLLKNCYIKKKKICVLKRTEKAAKFLLVLYRGGWINGFYVEKNMIIVHLSLRYTKTALRKFGLISKSSHRIYIKKKQLTFSKLLGFLKNTGPMVLRTSFPKSEWLVDIECHLLGIGGEPIVLLG